MRERNEENGSSKTSATRPTCLPRSADSLGVGYDEAVAVGDLGVLGFLLLHVLQNLSCHRETGLLNIVGVFGTRLEEFQSQGVGEFLENGSCHSKAQI